MQVSLNFSAVGNLMTVPIPPDVSDIEAVSWLRSVAERWPSTLSIADSTTLLLTVELPAHDVDVEKISEFVEQLLCDSRRNAQRNESTSSALENLVTSIIDRSLGAK